MADLDDIIDYIAHDDPVKAKTFGQELREPTGPAKALLHAIRRDPESVMKALVA